MSVATRTQTSFVPALYMAIESGQRKWKVAFTVGLGQDPRVRRVDARHLEALAEEIAKAKARFGLAAEAEVYNCYEAGRDGFWLHRALLGMGVWNEVVDSASIEVPRRKRRAKTDRLDAGKLATLLVRYHLGDQKALRVVRAPTPGQEDMRQLHRELRTARRDRTRLVNRSKSLLATQGIAPGARGSISQNPRAQRMWNGEPLPERLCARLEREAAQARELDRRIRELVRERKALLRHSPDPAVALVRRLMRLRGIGIESAWVYAMEFFAWRRFRNGREVAALAGLAPTPHQSGDESRELGITKAGNRHVRALAVEIAWGWLAYQPESALSQWYNEKFASGGARRRRIGIVALARKLLVALWRYAETGVVPEGAVLEKRP